MPQPRFSFGWSCARKSWRPDRQSAARSATTSDDRSRPRDRSLQSRSTSWDAEEGGARLTRCRARGFDRSAGAARQVAASRLRNRITAWRRYEQRQHAVHAWMASRSMRAARSIDHRSTLPTSGRHGRAWRPSAGRWCRRYIAKCHVIGRDLRHCAGFAAPCMNALNVTIAG